MEYNINNLPDFFSVRNTEQIDYSMEQMEGKICYLFFDNGFASSIIEPNKRDIRFIWDGFMLFTNPSITLEDIKRKVNLYDSRLVAFQRTTKHLNDDETRIYIMEKLKEKNIPFKIMPDINLVSGYPSQSDLWSTREKCVLMDATDCTKDGNAYYFNDDRFSFTITFSESNLPTLNYKHKGAIVLKGESSTAIVRLLENNQQLREEKEKTIGSNTVYSYLEQRLLKGTTIKKLK